MRTYLLLTFLATILISLYLNPDRNMSQKALLLRQIGTPLVLGSRRIPQPGMNQLLVKVIVAGLNPHDQRTRDSGLFVAGLPHVPASDLVGEVVTVGEGEHSSNFHVGEHVFGHTFVEDGEPSDFNAAQQYALADARFFAKVADTGLSDDEASTIPVMVLAAFAALFSKSGLGIPPPFFSKSKLVRLRCHNPPHHRRWFQYRESHD